jgi:hypothetical protein
MSFILNKNIKRWKLSGKIPLEETGVLESPI